MLTALLLLALAAQDREPVPLAEVKRWAYQIQELETAGAVDALAASTYDLLVIEPTRTSTEEKGFDARAMVARLKKSAAGDGVHRKLVLAYLDVGEAEDYRWYWTWSRTWKKGTPRPADWPAWIVVPDPDGWSGNYPVAFWDPDWKDLVFGGVKHPPTKDRPFSSMIDEVLQDGFDGVYLDWLEAYELKEVAALARKARRDPAAEMVTLVSEIRAAGRAKNPGFLVIQQNASALALKQPDLLKAVDGIAQEDLWYLGEADSKWEDAKGHDKPQEPAFTKEVTENLRAYRKSGKPVFTVDYTVRHAAEVYAKARELGFVPYCTRVALSRLSTTPPDPK